MAFFRRTDLLCQNNPPKLFKIRRPALGAFALLALGDVFNLAALKKGLHSNLAPAVGTIEFLCRARGTAVFTGLGHNPLLAGSPAHWYMLMLA